jgi:heat shock protein HtpX
MASHTRYPADRGLTARMLSTVFLLGLLYAAFVAILVAVHVKLGLILVLAFGILFVQYFFSDRIALYSMGGRIVTREQAPRVPGGTELFGVIDRLVALADMPHPQVAIANSDMPNAFATGRDQKHAVVCVTTGLLRRLDEPELEAVLAHELSHVAHRDVAVMTIASFLGILAGLMTRVFYFAGLFGGMGGYGGGRGGRGGNNNAAGQMALIELGMVLVSAVIYAISFVLIRTLSRYRELAADRSGAILIGQPALLAQALVKVSGEMSRIPSRDLRSAEHFNAFYFAPALAPGASISTLFATHPPLQRRLEQLAKLDAEMRRGAA